MKPKIIATIGPASEAPDRLARLAEAGVNYLRVNFSHATQDQFNRIKAATAGLKRRGGPHLKIIQDLQGPRIRIGTLATEMIMSIGETYTFIYRKKASGPREIPVDHREFMENVKPGDRFFLGNGEIELIARSSGAGRLTARVERGGLLASRKGINIPQTVFRGGSLTKKDMIDARFGLSRGVDAIALSFVQSAEDILRLRRLIKRSGVKKSPAIIAKIERAAALPLIDEIIRAADGIMIARGDLGIETPLEEIPLLQKNLIRHAHWHGKPAIVATEMLASMTYRARPTRAEVADIANAIFDGADAVMLSDETAIGKYPVEAVAAMKRISDRTDEYLAGRNYFDHLL